MTDRMIFLDDRDCSFIAEMEVRLIIPFVTEKVDTI
jgi:hypothetical protein